MKSVFALCRTSTPVNFFIKPSSVLLHRFLPRYKWALWKYCQPPITLKGFLFCSSTCCCLYHDNYQSFYDLCLCAFLWSTGCFLYHIKRIFRDHPVSVFSLANKCQSLPSSTNCSLFHCSCITGKTVHECIWLSLNICPSCIIWQFEFLIPQCKETMTLV